MCLNQLSSWCTHPHPLLTRHDLTHIILSSSAQVLTALTLCSYIHISSSSVGAPQHASTCDVVADVGFLCQCAMQREMIIGHTLSNWSNLRVGLVNGRNHKTGSKCITHLSVDKFNWYIYLLLVMLYSMKSGLFIEVCCLQAHNAVFRSESLLVICCLVVIFWRWGQ